MDLNVLFAPQVAELKRCYADLGHAPQRLQDALRSAIEHELARTVEEVDEAKAKIEVLIEQCDAYRRMLSADGASLRGPSNEAGLHSGTYFARIEQWQSELARLQRQYTSRRAHVDRLIETLDGHRPVLGDFVPHIDGCRSVDSDSASAPSPIPSLRAVEAALTSCTDELHRRTEALQSDLQTILQMWSDLAILPSADDGFEARVLRHLNVSPRLVDVGEGCLDFCGDFDDAFGGEAGFSEDDVTPCETPSRKSGSQAQLCGNGAAGGKASLMRPGTIVPTTENMSLAMDKRAELEAEQTRRTETLQALYDELIPLWRRFDVADEDVDAFVQANCGCTLTVLEAYESELRQMRELKSQHMALFISKVREDIALLWDQLMMNADERRESFPHFFYDLTESTAGVGEGSGVEPSDELLAMHEEKVRDLNDDLATRARPLELVRQYMRLLDEARELEESAKDTSRLMGRGAPGQKRDPGRLLREEKMRKRIKIIKPKVEEDLLKVIPAWEEESGRSFIINGARFLDTVELPVQQQKKRPRTVSTTQQQPNAAAAVAAAVATPQQLNSKRRQIDGSAPRSVSASSASTAAERRPQQQQPQPTPTMTNRQARNVTGPMLPSFATPQSQPRHRSAATNGSSVSAASRSTFKANGGSALSQTASASILSTSHAHETTTLVLKNGPRANAGGMQPPPPPTPSFLRDKSQAGKVRQAAAGRPSLRLEASLRQGPRPSSDFVKPASTGAGSTMRPLPTHLQHHVSASVTAANDSLGPNWAVLDDDDENLLMM